MTSRIVLLPEWKLRAQIFTFQHNIGEKKVKVRLLQIIHGLESPSFSPD